MAVKERLWDSAHAPPERRTRLALKNCGVEGRQLLCPTPIFSMARAVFQEEESMSHGGRLVPLKELNLCLQRAVGALEEKMEPGAASNHRHAELKAPSRCCIAIRIEPRIPPVARGLPIVIQSDRRCRQEARSKHIAIRSFSV